MEKRKGIMRYRERANESSKKREDGVLECETEKELRRKRSRKGRKESEKVRAKETGSKKSKEVAKE